MTSGAKILMIILFGIPLQIGCTLMCYTMLEGLFGKPSTARQRNLRLIYSFLLWAPTGIIGTAIILLYFYPQMIWQGIRDSDFVAEHFRIH